MQKLLINTLFVFLFGSFLGAVCLRSGDYYFAIKTLSRQITKLKNLVTLAEKDANKEWASTLHFMLAQCYYHRSLALYIRLNEIIWTLDANDAKWTETLETLIILDRLIDDVDQCVDESEKAELSEFVVAFVVGLQFSKFYEPLAEFLEALVVDDGDFNPFRIVPRANQSPFAELERDKDEIKLNIDFAFDLEYADDSQKK